MELTERDCEIIRLVHRYRFLRSYRIVALIGGNAQQLLRRLKLLYHHGYLERPRAQLNYYHRGGSRHIAYGVGNKGESFLRRKDDVPFRKFRWGEKNRSIGRMFLEHALLVSDVIATIELACRKADGIRLLTEEELIGEDRRPLHWKVNLNGRRIGIIPDRVFGLEFPDQNGKYDRAFFFLEADRGTMPVIRRNLFQTSFYRKLLAYEATWSQSIHRSRFGFNRFRVVTITTSASRVKSLLDACSKLRRGHGLFLFADHTVLQKDIFSPVWRTSNQGEPAALLN